MDPITQQIALASAGAGGANLDVIKVSKSSPYLEAYPFDPSSGFGTKYSNPSTGLPNDSHDVAITSDNSAVFFAHIASPYISAYSYSVGSGIGTKFSNPSTAVSGSPYQANAIAIHPNDNAVAVCTDTNPKIHVYEWSSSGFGAKYSDPSTAVGGSNAGWDVHWHPSGNSILVVAQGHYEYSVAAYAWSSSSGFGSKYSSPSYNNGMALNCGQFSPDGNYVVLGGQKSPYISALNWSNSSGFGSYLSNPSSNVGNNINSLKFDSTGSYLGVAHRGPGHGIRVYAWSSGFGSLYSPSNGYYDDASDIAFSPDSDAIVGVGEYSTNHSSNIVAWGWSASGFGSEFTPSTFGSVDGKFGGVRFTN